MPKKKAEQPPLDLTKIPTFRTDAGIVVRGLVGHFEAKTSEGREPDFRGFWTGEILPTGAHIFRDVDLDKEVYYLFRREIVVVEYEDVF